MNEQGKRRWASCRRHLVAFVVAVNVCVLLEVLDFPPLAGLLDAHGLWHAATIPLTRLWYAFLALDAAKLQQSGKRP